MQRDSEFVDAMLAGYEVLDKENAIPLKAALEAAKSRGRPEIAAHGGDRGIHKTNGQICPLVDAEEESTKDVPRISQSQAADMLNVSERSVKRAAQVRKYGTPDLQKAVERGEIPISAASD
jgi:hypothetical protein